MASWSQIARRIRVPLGFVLAAGYLVLARPTWESIIAGSILVVPGVWLRAVAAGHVRKNAELTTSGPYAYTRNPLYLGSILIAAGFALASRSVWVAVLAAVVFLAIYVPVIRAEEAYLRSRFPQFDEYARRVPRLVPRLRRENAGRMAFSRELYLRHREYNALIGSLFMMLALAVKRLWLGP